MSSELIRQAEIAIGSSYSIMEDYYFSKQMGWHYYWDPDKLVARATNNVKSLIWC